MSRAEALATPLGEMLDMMAAHAIASGAAGEKAAAVTSFDRAMELR